MSQRPFILCADDFALSTSSSQGILQLLEKSRLSAVSCVVNMPSWPMQSQALLSYRGKVDLGLHFNLTEGSWLSHSAYNNIGLKQLIIKAYTGRLSSSIVTAELLAQIEAFTKAMGQAPDFIDGHQHIQQLPGIRQAILAWLQTQTSDDKPYLRCSYLNCLFGNDTVKRWVINRLGAKTLRRQLAKTAIRYNREFSGVYDFSPDANYPLLFQQFLRELRAGGLIMCHPAQGFDPQDPHTLARQKEWTYFMSDAFLNDCSAAGLYLSRGDFLPSSLRA